MILVEFSLAYYANEPETILKHFQNMFVSAVFFAFVSVMRIANSFQHGCTRYSTDNTSAPDISRCRTSLWPTDAVAN